MDLKITPFSLSGEVFAPPSKSAAHRVLICGALAEGDSRITPYCSSDDIKATVECLSALGMKVEEGKEGYIASKAKPESKVKLNFGESGTTARFLLPIAAALGSETLAEGKNGLKKRPMEPIISALKEHSIEVTNDKLPLKTKGKLTAGDFYLSGNISSQFISGLLLAAPLLEDEVNIVLTTPLQSVGYIDMTVDTMKKYGVEVQKTESGWCVHKGSGYHSANTQIEGDWSAAACFMAAAAIGGDIKIGGLNFLSCQGDMAALDVFAAFGANISIENDLLHIRKGTLRGIEVNAENIPDMVPAIAVTAAFASGKTVIRSVGRLRFKESDRIKTIVAMLDAMGIKTEVANDSLIVFGGKPKGAVIDSANDHRIVMAASIAACFAEGESIIKETQAVNKSYPEFFEDFRKLGGKTR